MIAVITTAWKTLANPLVFFFFGLWRRLTVFFQSSKHCSLIRFWWSVSFQIVLLCETRMYNVITSWIMWYFLLCIPLVVILFEVTNSSRIKQFSDSLLAFLLCASWKSSPNFARQYVKSTVRWDYFIDKSTRSAKEVDYKPLHIAKSYIAMVLKAIFSGLSLNLWNYFCNL